MITTSADIARTAHRYATTGELSYGVGQEHGINEVCRCCKSVDTTKLHGPSMLPFKEFYKTLEFGAYSCNSCSYVFSWFKELS